MERSQFLQAMRFVAAALVLCAHITFYYHERVDIRIPVWNEGAVGVPIFFVISGFVMVFASRSLPQGAPGAREFLLRRVIRIVPLWWLALTVKVVIAVARPDVVNHNHFQVDYALKSYFFIPYFSGDSAVVPLHGVGWTLLHELFFYLLFSLAIFLKLRPVLWVSITIISLFVAGTVWQLDAAWWAVATKDSNLHFVLGMALATLLAAPRSAGRLRHVLVACASVAALVMCLPPVADVVHFMYPVLLIFSALTLLVVHRAVPRLLQWAVKLGDSSYSLYLFHPFIAPAAVLLIKHTVPGIGPWWHMLFVFVFTTIAAHALHLAVEVPLVRRARILLLRARGQAPTSASRTA